MLNRISVSFIFCILFSITAIAQPGYWPTSGWRTASPESQGIDSAMLAEAIESARKSGVNIHSLLVVRNNFIVAEAYFYPYDGKAPHDLASVTKSITGTLVGMAIEQKKIKGVDQKALQFFSKMKIANKDPRKEKITVGNLLTMSSGLNCIAKGEPTLWEMLNQPDNAKYMLDLAMVSEPGSNFSYCSGGMHLLSAIISNATGMNEEAFAKRFLFEPIGIKQLIWPVDPQNVNHGFGNLHLLPRDMAKLGVLYLNGGRWDGRQIIPADWVNAATTSKIKTGGARDYGYGWWIPAAGGLIPYEASGRGGQQISVMPSKNTVIVFNGGGFNTGDVMKLIQPAIKSDQPLPENPTAAAKLKESITWAAKPNPPPAVFPPLPAIAKAISGRTFTVGSNWIGLKTLTLRFPEAGDPTAKFSFIENWNMNRLEKLSEVRPVGLDGVLRLSPNGRYGLSVGVRGSWADERTFVLEYDEVANLNSYTLRMSFTEKTVSIQAKERTGLFDEKFEGKIEDMAK